jgi:hypothetical protein
METIREMIDAAAVATLDRMARGHMVPVIESGDCWECETTRGEGFIVPADIHGIPEAFADGFTVSDEATDDEREAELDGVDTGEYSAARLFSGLAQYMPEGCCGQVRTATVRRNVYLCRMSAPGYMDCTDWECHATAQAAADSLVDNYGEE